MYKLEVIEFLSASVLILQLVTILYAVISIHSPGITNKRAWWIFIGVTTFVLIRRMFMVFRFSFMPQIIYLEYIMTDLISLGWIFYIYERTRRSQ